MLPKYAVPIAAVVMLVVTAIVGYIIDRTA